MDHGQFVSHLSYPPYPTKSNVCTRLFIQSFACFSIQSNACLNGARYSTFIREEHKSEKRG